ncbi:MAG: hypothetical protein PHH54_04975 [Candidatus Nanoarchaeia archaeon]|nr:hypothetical protein [Candidatus Nanoarchaeia archaeon]MDD5741311.1 hypothetical protein [Candidatus Nanoarchaeia archaeon]
MKLTGKVFKNTMPEGSESEKKPVFQLEAEVDGIITRLQADGEIPEACLFDKRHSGLKVTNTLESLPPQYVVECSCGYSITMTDPNYFFNEVK